MKECPFIDTCEDKTSESNFKSYCQVRFGFFFNYKNCPTYQRKQGTYPKPRKKLLQEPRGWKQEKEES